MKSAFIQRRTITRIELLGSVRHSVSLPVAILVIDSFVKKSQMAKVMGKAAKG
ncbi:MAG: hypothetical protein P1U80_06925 [Pseudomonadales bacterium]|nr:hypothetical protein [Pseudomonadales bacterium]